MGGQNKLCLLIPLKEKIQMLFLIEQELPTDEALSVFPAEQASSKPVRQKEASKGPETEHTKIKGPELGTHLPEPPNLIGAQEKKKGPVTQVTTLWLI